MEQKNEDSDLQEIKKLIALMETHNLVEIEIAHSNDKILLKRADPHAGTISGRGVAQPPVGEGGSDEIKNLLPPGTLYVSVGPDSEPFVKIGSKVEPQTKVCIIEVMKVMNEINAGITGQIVEILVENGQAVEYGQPLFKVRPE